MYCKSVACNDETYRWSTGDQKHLASLYIKFKESTKYAHLDQMVISKTISICGRKININAAKTKEKIVRKSSWLW